MPGEHSGNPDGYTEDYLRTHKPYKTTRSDYDPARDSIRVGAGRSSRPSRPTPRSSSTGGSSGYGGSGGGGFNPLGQANAVPVDPNAWMQDPTYIQQHAALVKALADYQSQMNDTLHRHEVDYGRSKDALSLDQTRSTAAQQDDYASRGMFLSGLMAKARADLASDYLRRFGDMSIADANYTAGVNRDFANFKTSQDLQEQKAKQDAIDRAAAGLGF